MPLGPDDGLPDGDIAFEPVDELTHGSEGFFAMSGVDDDAHRAFADVDAAAAVVAVEGEEGVFVQNVFREGAELFGGHWFVVLIRQRGERLSVFNAAHDAVEDDRSAGTIVRCCGRVCADRTIDDVNFDAHPPDTIAIRASSSPACTT